QGYNPNAVCIRHTLEPVIPFNHRPLAFYIAFKATRGLSWLWFKAYGFQRMTAPCKTVYWYREIAPPPSVSGSPLTPSQRLPAQQTSPRGRRHASNSSHLKAMSNQDRDDKGEPWLLPVVFFHGVSPGLVAYVHMV
ncbi:unnamed protein product, partial [Choristocarpus tenellus]